MRGGDRLRRDREATGRNGFVVVADHDVLDEVDKLGVIETERRRDFRRKEDLDRRRPEGVEKVSVFQGEGLVFVRMLEVDEELGVDQVLEENRVLGVRQGLEGLGKVFDVWTKSFGRALLPDRGIDDGSNNMRAISLRELECCGGSRPHRTDDESSFIRNGLQFQLESHLAHLLEGKEGAVLV